MASSDERIRLKAEYPGQQRQEASGNLGDCRKYLKILLIPRLAEGGDVPRSSGYHVDSAEVELSERQG